MNTAAAERQVFADPTMHHSAAARHLQRTCIHRRKKLTLRIRLTVGGWGRAEKIMSITDAETTQLH